MVVLTDVGIVGLAICQTGRWVRRRIAGSLIILNHFLKKLLSIAGCENRIFAVITESVGTGITSSVSIQNQSVLNWQAFGVWYEIRSMYFS